MGAVGCFLGVSLSPGLLAVTPFLPLILLAKNSSGGLTHLPTSSGELKESGIEVDLPYTFAARNVGGNLPHGDQSIEAIDIGERASRPLIEKGMGPLP